MKTIVHRASDRGKGEHGWLSTRYSFSFADWYDPSRMGFGALRVINDDRIAPGSGFGAHGHKDMEIITLVTSGTITHEDSMGNKGTVPRGDVQAMSAGTGVVHSERNDSPDEELTLFQIWIATGTPGARPRYAQRAFGLEESVPGLTLLAAGNGAEGALPIHQDAYLYHGVLTESEPLSYALNDLDHGAYVFVIEGTIRVGGETLGPRDAIGISAVDEFTLEADERSRVLIIEVPL